MKVYYIAGSDCWEEGFFIMHDKAFLSRSLAENYLEAHKDRYNSRTTYEIEELEVEFQDED